VVDCELHDLTVTGSVGDGVEGTGVGEDLAAGFEGLLDWTGWWGWEGTAEAASETAALLWLWWGWEATSEAAALLWLGQAASETATEATALHGGSVDADVVDVAVDAADEGGDVVAGWNCALEVGVTVTAGDELLALVGSDHQLLEDGLVEAGDLDDVLIEVEVELMLLEAPRLGADVLWAGLQLSLNDVLGLDTSD